MNFIQECTSSICSAVVILDFESGEFVGELVFYFEDGAEATLSEFLEENILGRKSFIVLEIDKKIFFTYTHF